MQTILLLKYTHIYIFLPYSFSGAHIRGDLLLVIFRRKTLLLTGIVLICLTVTISIFAWIVNDTSSLYTINIDEEKKFIKWVVLCALFGFGKNLSPGYKSYGKKSKLNWIELIAYLQQSNGGNFKNI